LVLRAGYKHWSFDTSQNIIPIQFKNISLNFTFNNNNLSELFAQVDKRRDFLTFSSTYRILFEIGKATCQKPHSKIILCLVIFANSKVIYPRAGIRDREHQHPICHHKDKEENAT
jgi:hypothetical protein